MARRLLFGVSILFLAAACSGSGSTPTPPSDGPNGAADGGGALLELTLSPPVRGVPVVPDLDAVPSLDLSISVVDPSDVVYDTFDGSFTSLPQAAAPLVRRLRDAIRPIYEPEYDDAATASRWLGSSDRVVGFELDGHAYAYPTGTVSFREIVNETFDDLPVAVTFCPLCASGVVFDRRLSGETLLFGNTSALYDQDLVMYDHQTGSYWHQTSGTAIVGELFGKRLEPLPSLMTTFGEWKELYPGTSVLSNSKERIRSVGDSTRQIQEAADRGVFFFPVREEAQADRSLDLGAEVLMVRLAGHSKAYALTDLQDAPANDRVADIPVAVFASSAGALAGYVARTDDGRELTFDAADDDTFVDRETGTVWNVGGRAMTGAQAGTQLTMVPGWRALWFSIAGSNPDVPLYTP